MPNPKTYEYTAKMVSEAARLPIRNVYHHVDSGRLVLSDLRSVAMFIGYYYYGAMREQLSSGVQPPPTSCPPKTAVAPPPLAGEDNE